MLENIVKEIIKRNPQTEEDFLRLKRELFSKNKIRQVANSELLKLYNRLIKNKSQKNDKIRDILKKRKVRTLSGVAPIAVLTKAHGCPGKCVYCPTEKNMPKSYLSNEPAVMRAIMCSFNPFKQVTARIKALEANGHDVSKIELIVMGGTWSTFSKKYQYWYIKELFRAANTYNKRNGSKGSGQKYSHLKISESRQQLFKEQKINESGKYRIVGLTLETRPDYVDNEEVVRFREMGCTRVEIGVQAIDDKILKLTKRGHGVDDIVRATKLLKTAGFKICYHIMPNLPGSTLAKDFAMFKKIFYDKRFVPDQIKIYPCVVVRGAELYDWWTNKRYKPYTDKQLEDLLVKIKKIIPYYIRIVRLIRDIPTISIEAGNKMSNLRQVLQKRLKDEGASCKCIRCREARGRTVDIKNADMFVEKYNALDATEYFLSIESRDRSVLYAFLRLRVPVSLDNLSDSNNSLFRRLPELKNAAIIREVHTYGKLVSVDNKNKDGVQHQGFGKRLVDEAEKIAIKNDFEKISVISGVGVRAYYKKLGYKLDKTYMVKNI